MRRLLFPSLIIALLCSPLLAQGPRISHIVMGPGDEVYEKFGHNALRIEDPNESGDYRDVAFNYGLFSFGGDFIYRFLRGDMQYWMAAERAPTMIENYRHDERTAYLQVLNLTDAQATSLQRFLWTNSLPENRYYLYNYYTDNCSTRIRDALDRATGGEIRRQTVSIPTGHSYRYHTRRAMAGSPIVYIALAYIIGQDADRELTQWDEMFLPELLGRHLRGVLVDGAPIISEDRPLYAGAIRPLPESPPAWTHWFLIGGVTFALVLFLLSRLRSRLARFSLGTLLIAWFALGTFASLFLAMFNIASIHWATYRNENILQLSPAAILLLAVVPWALSRKSLPRHHRMRRFAMVFSLLALALSTIGLLLKATPFFFQQNWEIIAMALPVHAAIAMIFWQWSTNTPHEASESRPSSPSRS